MTDETEEQPERPARSRKRTAKADAGEQTTPETRPAATARSSPKQALPAHTPPTGSDSESGAATASPAMARADELIDQAGQRVGHFLSDMSHRLRVFAARAQEEGEDILAEAQDLRNKEHS